METLVTAGWLAGEMGASDLRIVDATQFLADHGRDALSEYEAGHIPGALFMDLAGLADSDAAGFNMLPPPEKFASRMQSLGLGDGSRIVLYDNSPLKSAARAWFMLKMYGAHHVAILDGGLAAWIADDRPLESGITSRRHRHFTAWRDASWLRDKQQVTDSLRTKLTQIVDARPAERFAGTAPEPRAGIMPGHIPGSVNLPYSQLFNTDGTWKRGASLRAAFTEAGVDLERPVITSCGSGITAAVLLFGMHLLGKTDVSLYDGSWAEWGADPHTPKETGAGTGSTKTATK